MRTFSRAFTTVKLSEKITNNVYLTRIRVRHASDDINDYTEYCISNILIDCFNKDRNGIILKRFRSLKKALDYIKN